MAVLLIGMTIGDQCRDDIDHLGNMLGRPRLHCWRQATKFGSILTELGCCAFGQVADALAVFTGAGVDLVLNVRDVADIGHQVML